MKKILLIVLCAVLIGCATQPQTVQKEESEIVKELKSVNWADALAPLIDMFIW